MKLSIWRLASIAIIFMLGMTVWYMREVNDSEKKTTAVLADEKKSLEKNLTDVYEQKKGLEAEIEAIKKEKDDLAAKITDHETRMQQMSGEIEKLKSDIALRDREIAKKNAQIKTLKKTITGYESDIAELSKKAYEPPPEAAETSSTAKEEKADKSVTLEPITVTTPKAKKENMKVLEINSDYGFVVIKGGKDSGLQKDDILFIYRRKTLIGRVIVEKVGDDTIIAAIPNKMLANDIRKDDTVTY